MNDECQGAVPIEWSGSSCVNGPVHPGEMVMHFPAGSWLVRPWTGAMPVFDDSISANGVEKCLDAFDFEVLGSAEWNADDLLFRNGAQVENRGG